MAFSAPEFLFTFFGCPVSKEIPRGISVQSDFRLDRDDWLSTLILQESPSFNLVTNAIIALFKAALVWFWMIQASV